MKDKKLEIPKNDIENNIKNNSSNNSDNNAVNASYNKLAKIICEKRLGEMALFLFESHRPLVNIAKELLVVFSPILKLFLKKELQDEFLTIFDSSANYDNFIKSLNDIMKSENKKNKIKEKNKCER